MKDLGIDIFITAPQKGWSSPASVGIVMLNQNALDKLKIKHDLYEDGILIEGKNDYVDYPGYIDSFDDHRIAMSFLIAGIRSKNGIGVKNCQNIETSFPGFKAAMTKLGMKINEKD